MFYLLLELWEMQHNVVQLLLFEDTSIKIIFHYVYYTHQISDTAYM